MENSFLDLLRCPQRCFLRGDGNWESATSNGGGFWACRDVGLHLYQIVDELKLSLSAGNSRVEAVQIRWKVPEVRGLVFLSDAWERGYGNLEFRSLRPERVMPWYFLATKGRTLHGVGVKTDANALSFWRVTGEEIVLDLDVRCGGAGVELNGGVKQLATVVAFSCSSDETVFKKARRFLRQLAVDPIFAPDPVYGANDWYYAYGLGTQDDALRDAATVSRLSSNSINRPYSVIDGGWQFGESGCSGGPWLPNSRYSDLPSLPEKIRQEGARPGIWFRPLAVKTGGKAGTFLRRPNAPDVDGERLDPTNVEALEQIRQDVSRLTDEYGFELIKHDFSTYDLLGDWGFKLGSNLADGGWSLHDATKTNAEALKLLYVTIKRAAGSALVIGCNVIPHLAVGSCEIVRTGDDTSGKYWERTRIMGVNSLAFRGIQQGVFFEADADCVGLTPHIPWEMNRQWLDLLSRSGTPLFVSIHPDSLGTNQEKALRTAFSLAAKRQPVAEPLDWLTNACPNDWKVGDSEVRYIWNGFEGEDFLQDLPALLQT